MFYMCACEQDVSGDSCRKNLAKVWDNTFQNKKSFEFVDNVFNTVKDMGVNPVCSDTIQSIAEFIRTEATNSNSLSLSNSLIKIMETLMAEFAENKRYVAKTKKVIERIYNDSKVYKLVTDAIYGAVKLLQKPENWTRLAIMARVIKKITEPSEAEIKFKKTIENFTKKE